MFSLQQTSRVTTDTVRSTTKVKYEALIELQSKDQPRMIETVFAAEQKKARRYCLLAER